MTTRTSSLVDHDARWRPLDPAGSVCRYTFRDKTCEKSGAHYCEPRADRVVMFFRRLLVHTKGPLKRTAFVLLDWQEHEIIRPLFGEVAWSSEWGAYCRRFRIAYIIVARKNGKSEIAAGIQLYMLVGDDEESAEVYCAAKDTKQAGKVFEPALRMVQLSPALSKRVKHFKNARRLVDEQSASHYEILTADAKGELGHNPHAFNLDEVLSQPDGTLWEAMTSASGARLQELCYATTTETNDPTSFGADLIDEAERVQEDPSRSPHVFSFVRKMPNNDEQLGRLRRLFAGRTDLPVSLDPFDERNWKWSNPALDQFKSRDSMRRMALEARQDPTKENGFKQFQMNQRVQQVTRWLSLQYWDQQPNMQMLSDLDGRACYGGVDLSSKLDLTALCWTFPVGDTYEALWRFWLPEKRLPDLDRRTGARGSVWAREGLLTVTPGDVIDYSAVEAQIDADARRFDVREIAFDPWGATQMAQRLTDNGLLMVEFRQGYRSMSEPLKEWQKLIISGRYVHGGNPIMRWMADNLVVRADPNGNLAPDKSKSHEKIDGCVAAVMSLSRAIVGQARGVSVYESRGLEMV